MRKKETKAERLYATHHKAMLAEAMSVLGNRTSAEDAVSEAFVKIMHNIDRIEEEHFEKTRAFLIIICRNTAKDMCKEKTMLNYDDDLSEQLSHNVTPENVIISKETADRITNIIEKLDPIYRDVFLLRNAYKLPREEISSMLNISLETVKKRLQRGKAKIIAELEKEGIIYDR